MYIAITKNTNKYDTSSIKIIVFVVNYVGGIYKEVRGCSMYFSYSRIVSFLFLNKRQQ